ncbi:hypothetical protein KAS79_02905 [Candidatus Parcubacteria bacterium]|nr:hypothetical protein [Candidatus Parcubacteria bacterium]
MAKKIKIFFLILIFGSFVFSPLISLAANQYSVEGGTVSYEGIVPCGKPIELNGTCCILPCTLCHFFVMFEQIINFFMLTLVPAIAVLMIVIGGLIFLLSGQNPSGIDQGKRIMTSTAKGLVIIFASWLIINTFFVYIKAASWTGLSSGWFQIKCGITTNDCDPRRKCNPPIITTDCCLGSCCKDLPSGTTPCATFHSNGDQVSDAECQ